MQIRSFFAKWNEVSLSDSNRNNLPPASPKFTPDKLFVLASPHTFFTQACFTCAVSPLQLSLTHEHHAPIWYTFLNPPQVHEQHVWLWFISFMCSIFRQDTRYFDRSHHYRSNDLSDSHLKGFEWCSQIHQMVLKEEQWYQCFGQIEVDILKCVK